MESKFVRDKTVQRVHGIFEVYPTFMSLNVVSLDEGETTVRVMDSSEAAYVIALHEVCVDSIPIGRNGDKIVGKLAPHKDTI